MKKILFLIFLILIFKLLPVKAQENYLQAIDCNQFDKIPNSIFWKSGTKKFCDNIGWILKVSVTGNILKVETFSDKNNSYHKDKIHPVSIEYGKIIDNVVYSKLNNRLLKNQFRYINGEFYEINDENQYSIYGICKVPVDSMPNYTKIDLKEKKELKNYLSKHKFEFDNLSGVYINSSIITIKSGKAFITLIGENDIAGVIKKTGKDYVVYFLEPDETPNLHENWTLYSKTIPIANLSVVDSNDLKIQWFGLYNRQTHLREYEELDGDPNSHIKIFKKK